MQQVSIRVTNNQGEIISDHMTHNPAIEQIKRFLLSNPVEAWKAFNQSPEALKATIVSSLDLDDHLVELAITETGFNIIDQVPQSLQEIPPYLIESELVLYTLNRLQHCQELHQLAVNSNHPNEKSTLAQLQNIAELLGIPVVNDHAKQLANIRQLSAINGCKTAESLQSRLLALDYIKQVFIIKNTQKHGINAITKQRLTNNKHRNYISPRSNLIVIHTTTKLDATKVEQIGNIIINTWGLDSIYSICSANYNETATIEGVTINFNSIEPTRYTATPRANLSKDKQDLIKKNQNYPLLQSLNLVDVTSDSGKATDLNTLDHIFHNIEVSQ